jgi:hypothetical protein
MSKRRTNRPLRYVLGSAFALLISACVGGLTFLFLSVLLPCFELLPPESVQVAIGVGCLLALVALATQFWAFVTHDTLRPRRAAQISHRSASNPP